MLSSEPLLRHRHSLSHYLHAGLVKYLHKASSFQNGCQGHLQVVQEGKESAPASTRVCLEKEKEVKPEWRPAQRLDDGDPGLVYLQKAFSEGKESAVSTRVCLEQEKEVKLEGRPAQRLDDGDPGLVYLQKASSLQTGCQGHPPVAQEGKESAAASTSMCLEQEKEVELGGRPAERLDDGDPGLVYRDDDRLWTVVSSVVKIVTCFSAMLLTTIFWTIIMLLLLPFPYVRIKQGNVYGHVTGRILMWILANPIKIYGTEYANLKAIYVCNHASPLDIFLVMWLTPTGTVGIAKKEIIWYPLFGQLYVLANHLRIDRSNSVSSIQSMRKIARTVVDRNLSLIVFPEGTRSASGRLLPFKKGFVHLAIQTKLPIVPMVLTGTHLGWQKNSLRVRPAPLTVTYLPPIKTDDWTTDNVETYVDMLHALYAKHLPPSQKPLEMVADNSH